MEILCFLFFFNDTATTEIYTLSLHDALPIYAADLDRLEQGPRVEGAGAPHADLDLVQPRHRRHRRPLERAGPARPFVQRTETALLVERVDLDHDAVDLVVELGAPQLPFGTGSGDLLDRLDALGVRVRAEASLAQPLERLRVRPQAIEAFAMSRAVDPDRERTRRGDGRILLPQRAGGGVARVRPGRLPFGDEPLVGLAEARERHVHLAAHLELCRQLVAAHLQRNGADRPEVRRHVLTLDPVAARGAAREAPVFVQEVDRRPVDLRLEHVGDRLAPPVDSRAEPLADVAVPLRERLVGRHLVE